MNFALDRLVRTVARDPQLLAALAADPPAAAARHGVSPGELEHLIAGDLAMLRAHGVHPLLLMYLAGALRIDPVAVLGRPATE